MAAATCMLVFLLALSGGLAEAKKVPVRIGALHNVSGPLGSIGAPSLAGARLAAKQLNDRGGLLGRPVELASRDGRSDPAVVAAQTRELVRTPHLAAITGLNDTAMALAAAPIAEKKRTVFLTSGATSPLVASEFPGFYFMACFGDNTQAAAGAEYAYGVLGAETAWVLFDDTTDYTSSSRATSRSATRNSAARSSARTRTRVERPISRHRSSASSRLSMPEVLSVSAGPDDIGRLVRQLRDAGIDRPIVGGDGYDTPLLLEQAGTAADEVYFTTHAFLDPRRQHRGKGSSSPTTGPSTASRRRQPSPPSVTTR